jgi:phosphopantothenoylcysteine decarboxylase/phosphopantothenate--cysteine ligase
MSRGLRPDSAATPSRSGRGRRVLLLVTGGIAAYKACTVVRRLVDAGCEVRVAMTDSAQRFVGPLSFEALSGQPVGTSLWGEGGEEPLDHIQWAQGIDLLLVAPATLNFIGKIAHGLADDLGSTLVSATDAPIMVAPSMNDRMWSSPANRKNLVTLADHGVEIIDPGSGYLACGTVAEGRLAEPEQIVDRVLDRISGGPLQGKRILVTAGGTREPIDAVRWVGNHSSGRMGLGVAEAARSMGASVTLLLGPTEIVVPDDIEVERFVNTQDLARLLDDHAPAADAIVMAAAVSDWRPVDPPATKLKKEDGPPQISLESTPDLLAGLAERRVSGQFLIGFALESGDDATVEEQARQKLERKRIDLVCGNRADIEGQGFDGDTNRLYLYDRRGQGEWIPLANKCELGCRILERAIEVATTDPSAESAS